ncbi:hypothetical protein EV421DRAFT_1740462 [Armillaria borealis]|uniref:Uncharacterized protein n=1 Tax=Armillaria borealis TaxID=47425 RepID=A0AA39J3P0_9AGAR|nr:hypothetical protein EV421DRAFT_1740462 [Armillaria borealis]
MHAEDEFHWFDCAGPTQIVLSLRIKVVFRASGGPKSPGWRAYHPHHQRKPSNEASPCATPIDDYHHVPTIDSDDNDWPYTAMATQTDPHPDPGQPSTSHTEIGANHHHTRQLHTPRVSRGATEDKTSHDEDNQEDDEDDGGVGRLEGTMIGPITIPVQPLPRPPLPAPPKFNIGLPRALQLSQPHKIRVSPIFWVGEHESDVRQASRCPSHRAAAPDPDPHPIPPILTPTAYPPTH